MIPERARLTAGVSGALLAPVLLALCAGGAGAAEPKTQNACIVCHAQLDGELAAPTAKFATDVHAIAGLGCEACHGGDASAAMADDPTGSMDPKRGFRPRPTRTQVAEFCGNCHSDAAYMKRFSPQARIDQLAEYRTSTHGKKNAAGDPVPATCIDCHGVHGIRPVSSPDSPVYAVNVPATCGQCHSDARKMASYGLRTDQLESYRRSVHGTMLLELGDTSAPACNDCHGNHGAVPPGVSSVANVCGQCHGREASLFRASRKQAVFEDLGVAECTVCHDHHAILHPTPELFHSDSAPAVSNGKVVGTDPLVIEIPDLAAGGSASATWVSVLRPHLPGEDPRLARRIEVTSASSPALVIDATVRPGDRLGGEARRASSGPLAAALTIEAPSGGPLESGDAIRLRLELTSSSPSAQIVVRDRPGEAWYPLNGSVCRTCHEPGDACDKATEKMYTALTSLDQSIRGAQAELRVAEVSGMEVSGAKFELKSKGRTAAVEARALIHSFDPDRLLTRTDEGKGIAAAALDAARAALAELQFRRKGLGVSLGLVALVLGGLYLKIRQIDRATS